MRITSGKSLEVFLQQFQLKGASFERILRTHKFDYELWLCAQIEVLIKSCTTKLILQSACNKQSKHFAKIILFICERVKIEHALS